MNGFFFFYSGVKGGGRVYRVCSQVTIQPTAATIFDLNYNVHDYVTITLMVDRTTTYVHATVIWYLPIPVSFSRYARFFFLNIFRLRHDNTLRYATA